MSNKTLYSEIIGELDGAKTVKEIKEVMSGLFVKLADLQERIKEIDEQILLLSEEKENIRKNIGVNYGGPVESMAAYAAGKIILDLK